MMKAFGIYQERRPAHVDVLDLMEEANLAMLCKVGKALEARDPVTYLMAIATQAMRVYCTYHAPLIQRPEWYSRLDLQTLNALLPAPDHLDETQDLEAPALDLEGEAQQERRYRVHYRAFYAALFRLPRLHRSLLIRLYGLCGQPRETPADLAQQWQCRLGEVHDAASRARRRFAKVLSEEIEVSA
jgi:DNA-directed RNA polymerase specialized sigma24 family protein